MGYFPNSTAAEIFQSSNCYHCVHNPIDEDDDGCAVWGAHMAYNYDECNNPDSILHWLIPKDENKCNMFHASDPQRCTETYDMFEEDK